MIIGENNLGELSDKDLQTAYTTVPAEVMDHFSKELRSRGVDDKYLVFTALPDGEGEMDVKMTSNYSDWGNIIMNMFEVRPDVFFSLMTYISDNKLALTERYARLVFQKSQEQAGEKVNDLLGEVFGKLYDEGNRKSN